MTKNLSEEAQQKIVNPNPMEVITFLNFHCLTMIFKIDL